MKFRERLMLACAGLLCAACIVVFVRYGTHQHLIRDLGWDNAWTKMVFADNASLQHWSPPQTLPPGEVPVDWVAKYPYPPSPAPEQQDARLLERISQDVHACTLALETWTNERFFAYHDTATLMHAYLRATGWNVPLFNRPDGYSFQYADKRFASLLAQRDEGRQIASTAAFAAFCKERGINFVVVLVPWKFPRSSPYAGTLDFSGENADAYVAGLREQGIDVIDLRTDMERDGISYDDFFMKTDHHWTLATARWAASVLATHLNHAYGYQFDTSRLSASCFREERYPACFLGSHGTPLMLPASYEEDFFLSYPTYPTAFHLTIPSMEIDRQGDFSILYDMRQMTSDTYMYHTYAYGDPALLTIRNQAKADGKHLLFLHDSYGSAPTPFLALGVARLDSIDPRNFTGSLRTYIEREQPDTVVLCYGAMEFNLDDLLHSLRQPFDLR